MSRRGLRGLCLAGALLALAACGVRDNSSSSSSVPEQDAILPGFSSSQAPAPSERDPDGPPDEWLDGGVLSAGYGRAWELLQTMTDEEKAGQVLLARCPDLDAAGAVAAYHPGGLVLFGRDFSGLTAEEVKANLASYQAASSLPLLLATDEEGGEVVRVSSNPALASERFRSMRALYRAGGADLIEQDARAKAGLLLSLGVNLDLAPVADVSTDPNDYIYGRTVGEDAATTADCVAAAVRGLQGAGVSSALKHFPGYGDNPDTHTGSALDERPYEQFTSSDFLPFAAGIRAGARCVLVSHNVVACIDPDSPASLSPAVHEVLRGELGITGAVLTDDLTMEAARAAAGGEEAAVRALQAGNDLLIVSDLPASYEQIADALASGELDEAVLDRAVFRVLALKCCQGLL
ncbi:beta-hexosaminidase [Clostridiaceae bacterium NSJ-31]|uniref:beta-N-acetylhexosaminidase n=1 Tax=Ligaoa zhengdingensis TaxID=2763658 RepID=A0A926I539_9FIRM|nr:beta-hexosaminidase [Ligaoa zhengdingensis]